MPPEHRLNIAALSTEEWNYIRGLFMTDGYSRVITRGSSRAYIISFYLQGDEGKIAERVTNMLLRLGLNPRTKKRLTYKMIIIEAYSKSLLNFLPDKKALIDNAVGRERLLAGNKLFDVKAGIPFLAGLLDGDGSCSISVEGYYCFGSTHPFDWSFTQSRYPFLIDYVKSFIESLAPNGSKIGRTKRGLSVVRIRKSGINALLDEGIAKYSWKATRWLERVAKLRSQRESYYTVGQVARMINVSETTLRCWLRKGKMMYHRRIVTTRESPRSLSWHYIPSDVAKEFAEKFLGEKRRTERIRREGVKLIAAAKILGVPHRTLYDWYRCGKIRGTLLHNGGGHGCVIIPRDEVESFEKKKHDNLCS
nr:LAGLIDADG family homing endonuclease [Candidatus Njordarchaeum guaymaensis]